MKIQFILFLLLISLQLPAKILKLNGNFAVAYNDLSSHRTFILQRIYNSYNSTNFSGMWGPNWFYLYGTRLKKIDNDKVVIIEYGGGHKSVYTLTNGTAKNLKMNKQGWIRYEVNEKRWDYFDHNGTLNSMKYESGEIVRIIRDSNSQIQQAIHSSGKKIDFVYNDKNLLVEATMGDKKTIYRYDPSSNMLIYAKTINGKEFWYHYDDEQYLQTIEYSNGTSRHIYYEKGPDGSKWAIQEETFSKQVNNSDAKRKNSLHVQSNLKPEKTSSSKITNRRDKKDNSTTNNNSEVLQNHNKGKSQSSLASSHATQESPRSRSFYTTVTIIITILLGFLLLRYFKRKKR